MNWNIGFFIWLKGLAILAIPCLIAFPIGIWAIGIALVISWPAILFYSLSLQLLKYFKFPFAACIAFMMLVPSSVSIVTAMWLFAHFTDFGSETGLHFSEIYLVPLFFCMLSIGVSIGRIREYVDPDTISEEFIIK